MLFKNSLAIKLSISCVYFDTDEKVFGNTIESLAKSIQHAKENGLMVDTELHLINNNPQKDRWFTKKSDDFEAWFDKLICYTGHGNIGYGRGNNLAISSTSSDFHLVLNPDVFLAEDNILNALHHMQYNPLVDALAADAYDYKNNRLYLAKREPSLIILFVRAIDAKWLNNIFKHQLDNYEYRDVIPSTSDTLDIELMSGCYMLLRTPILQAIKGFNPEYFLYFEDFELSRRLKRKVLAFSVRILHLGGNAARKGKSHFLMFSRSMLKFLFAKYLKP